MHSHSPGLPARIAVAAAALMSAGMGTSRAQELPISLWGLEMVGRNHATEKGFVGAGVKVGIMDEAALPTHQEFATRWMGGFNVDGSPYGPPQLHGTHVSGTVAGLNVGVAPGALLYGINWAASNSDIGFASGYWWGLDQGVRLFNNSWSFILTDPDTGQQRTMTVADTTRPQLESNFPFTLWALFDSVSAGSVQVFATDNYALPQPSALAGLPYFYPELQPNWIAVTAVGPTGTLASYANHCGVAASWCIAAPGGDGDGNDGIWSASPISDDYYQSIDGTSMATPHVTGAMAVAAQMFPDADYTDLAQLVLQSATDIGDPGIDPVYGWGLLSVRNMVDSIDPSTGAVFADAAWSRFAAMGHVTQVIRNRIEAAPATADIALGASGAASAAGLGAWLMPVHGAASIGSGSDALPGDSDTNGIIGGIDFLDEVGARAGIAGGYTHARLSISGADDSARSDNLHLAVYGRWSANGWFVDGSAQLAHFDQSIERGTIAGAVGTSVKRVGRSDLSGHGAMADLRAGYQAELAQGQISPYALLIARWQETDASTESGAGIFSLNLPASSHSQWEAGPGIRYETGAVALSSHSLKLTLDLSYSRLLGDNSLATPVVLLGREIESHTAAAGRDVLRLGAQFDLTAASASGINWFAAYDGAFQTRASAHTFALGAHMRF